MQQIRVFDVKMQKRCLLSFVFPRTVIKNDIKASISVLVIPHKYFRINDFQLLSPDGCVLIPLLNPSVVRSFPPIFNWIFSLTGEVIYPFYLWTESRIPIERKLN